MTSRRSTARRGFTLAESIIAIVILAIVGASMMRILVVQSHLFQKAAAQRSTREVTRSATTIINSDLRMLEASAGVVSASSAAIQVRSPFAIGVVCGAGPGNTTTISMAPVDSTEWANAGLSGYAWRDTLGGYHYVETNVTTANGTPGVCNTASISTLPTGKVIDVSPALPAAAISGTPVFFEEQLKYEFKNSAQVTGAYGLWRTIIATGASEEIVTPFTSSARFRFFVADADTSQAAPPALLSSIRGIEFILWARSENAAGGAAAPESTQVNAAVYFRNSLN